MFFFTFHKEFIKFKFVGSKSKAKRDPREWQAYKRLMALAQNKFERENATCQKHG